MQLRCEEVLNSMCNLTPDTIKSLTSEMTSLWTKQYIKLFFLHEDDDTASAYVPPDQVPADVRMKHLFRAYKVLVAEAGMQVTLVFYDQYAYYNGRVW